MVLSLEEAIEISKSIQLTSTPSSTSPNQGTIRSDNYELLESKIILDKNDLEGIYILNQIYGDDLYFSIISADLNTPSILAFGEGTFDMEIPSPETQYWLAGQVKLIEFVRDNNTSEEEFIELVYGDNPSSLEDDGGGVGPTNPCEDPLTAYNYRIEITDGPLMSHTYGQRCVYNDDCPEMNCNIFPCGATEALTGCVATAIVQIMKHHEVPTSIPWAIMLDRYDFDDFGELGAVELADVMANAGLFVGMDYGCISSGVSFNGFDVNVINAFELFFGYSSGGFYVENNDPNGWNDFVGVQGNIRAGKPVMLGGFTDESLNQGHAWVCDGTRKVSFCDGKLRFRVNYFYHMNWGWNGEANGWYIGYGFFPNSTFRIISITP